MTSSTEIIFVVTNPPLGDKNVSLVSLNAGIQIYLKLFGSKYPIWKVQFYTLLVGYDLMGYVDGNLSFPIKLLDDANTKTNPSYTHWMHQDQLIVLATFSSITYTGNIMFGSVETSKNAWDIL
ncbi:hypothetical protein Lal_00042951 [Lupinus albus]|nr:hypothetical protein Lal_00042951 [Lupinus albus]